MGLSALAAGSAEFGRSVTQLLMTAPAVAAVLLLFAGGLAVALAQSFGHYGPVLADAEFQRSIALTLRVAVLSTVIAAAAAFGFAAALHQASARARRLIQVPVAVPHLVMSVAVIVALAPSGLLARALFALGLISHRTQFPQLLNDEFGVGIILVYVLKETPFLAVLCLAVLARVEPDYYAAARTLGAGAWQRAWYLTLPLVAPALAAGSAVVFAFVVSAFEVPYLLGRPYPAMLGVLAQRKFMSGEIAERPEAIAVALLGATAAAAALWMCMRLFRHFEERPHA